MEKKKIIVVLLLITIILSIASVVITFDLNLDINESNLGNLNNDRGNVQLTIEKNTETGEIPQ